MALRYSQLKTKSETRLRAMHKRCMLNIMLLERILVDCNNHHVPLTDEATNYIRERVWYYYNEAGKISDVRRFKYEPESNYKGGFGRWPHKPHPKRDLSFIEIGTKMDIEFGGKYYTSTVIKNSEVDRSITIRIPIGGLIDRLFRIGTKQTYKWTSYKFDDWVKLNIRRPK